MEEKKIIVTINEAKVVLQSNNPNIKDLVEKILAQDESFDFNNIEIECSDDNFDKDSFKKIIVDSVVEFKEQLIIENEINAKKNKEIDTKKKNNE